MFSTINWTKTTSHIDLWPCTATRAAKCYLDFLCSDFTDYCHVVFGDLYYSSDVLVTTNGKLINVHVFS